MSEDGRGGAGARARTAARARRGVAAAPGRAAARHPPLAKSSGRRRGDRAHRRLRRRVLGVAEQSQQDGAGRTLQHRSSHDGRRPCGPAARLCRHSPRCAPARAAAARRSRPPDPQRRSRAEHRHSHGARRRPGSAAPRAGNRGGAAQRRVRLDQYPRTAHSDADARRVS